MKNYKKLPIDPTPTPPPTLTRTTARCPLTRERGDDEVGVRWGGGTSWLGVRWGGGTLGGGGTFGGGGVTLGWIRWGGEITLGGGGGGVDVRNWSKMLILGTFRKITTYWPPLDDPPPSI